jgi:hypothetical protein
MCEKRVTNHGNAGELRGFRPGLQTRRAKVLQLAANGSRRREFPEADRRLVLSQSSIGSGLKVICPL